VKYRVTILLLLFLVAMPLLADPSAKATDDWNKPESAMAVPSLKVEGFSPDHLAGTWAIGTTYGENYEILARHWLDEGMALDFMLGGTYDPGPAIQPDTYNNFSWNFEVGFGLRQNIARPVKDVFVQMLVQLSYYQTYSTQTDTTQTPNGVATNQEQELNLYIGPGFEAFLPFWQNLSVEASIGANVSVIWREQTVLNNGFELLPNYSANNSWAWQAGIGNNNTTFSVLSAAVHYYF
jgi:hypothetical protein